MAAPVRSASGFQGGEGVADVLIAVGVVAAVEEGHQGIDDDEGGVGADDDGLEERDIAGEGEGPAELAAVGDGEEGDDAAGVAAGGVDAGADGVVEVVFGGEEEDAAGAAGLAAGEGLAAGDAGGELAEEGALAEAGIAVEDGDLAGGEAAGREPAHGLGVDLTQADDVAEGSRQSRSRSDSSFCDSAVVCASSSSRAVGCAIIEHMFFLGDGVFGNCDAGLSWSG